ncbi:CBS domain-containing protein [Clostridium gasigenes]|uniref:CBS domain-containing protein n=1 Tax=Clostridium gasigenes TaxID=94869 RepID=A0A1H0RZ89_9CLOT|nr:CBS domain-containing protein [Clostridium gasigenes]MBB6622659.1 CBS domain-containing protein [Clostridium gasigenes]MBB6714257.1 CBS domain-containing protein [Clostridium gasigenes]MBU3088591.1 CBS domain-containing protein [Clostridium gasigenes]MBU3103812.1 CBS domain-containing protein [Clostridium gasigenes]MBU3108236.1 CBS domain-containing protein [Clostridium gasigenes]
MNIAFFLTPKNEVIYEYLDATMRQVIERMEHHGYTAIPLIDKEGKYVGTLTEGDLLWELKNTPDLNFKNTGLVKVKDITRRVNHKSVLISADVESLISLATNQNFVPVVDDDGIFIGIIKRSDIINYCYNQIKRNKKDIV